MTTLRSSPKWIYLEEKRYVIGIGTDVPGISKVEKLVPTSTASQISLKISKQVMNNAS
jgi:hypothetical protein